MSDLARYCCSYEPITRTIRARAPLLSEWTTMDHRQLYGLCRARLPRITFLLTFFHTRLYSDLLTVVSRGSRTPNPRTPLPLRWTAGRTERRLFHFYIGYWKIVSDNGVGELSHISSSFRWNAAIAAAKYRDEQRTTGWTWTAITIKRYRSLRTKWRKRPLSGIVVRRFFLLLISMPEPRRRQTIFPLLSSCTRRNSIALYEVETFFFGKSTHKKIKCELEYIF